MDSSEHVKHFQYGLTNQGGVDYLVLIGWVELCLKMNIAEQANENWKMVQLLL